MGINKDDWLTDWLSHLDTAGSDTDGQDSTPPLSKQAGSIKNHTSTQFQVRGRRGKISNVIVFLALNIGKYKYKLHFSLAFRFWK